MNEDLDPFVSEQATRRARLLCATAGIPSHDIDDARQDLLLDFRRRESRFKKDRGEWEGFVRGVMRNPATVIATKRIRRLNREVLSGDLLEPGTDMSGGLLKNTMGANPALEIHLSLDVRRLLHALPDHLRKLACLLPESSIVDVCATTGKSRSRVYQMIRELRRAFIGAGLAPCGRPRRAGRSKVKSGGGK